LRLAGSRTGQRFRFLVEKPEFDGGSTRAAAHAILVVASKMLAEQLDPYRI
jgi:hypothetical protein